ncbi:MAG: type II toxin-antitoxin system RelE/ParE family toxin [Sphingobacteriaceae bacterium]|nr:MAG: type II toxin-antitoxin system RelE/ParE family toxin [Sphingobacteriaceae bacterium]
MAFEIVFTKEAETDFEEIITYINYKFGTQSANQFKTLILNFIELLQVFPEMGSMELPKENIRCFVAHKRLKVFYTLSDERIIILRLFDTRQADFEL